MGWALVRSAVALGRSKGCERRTDLSPLFRSALGSRGPALFNRGAVRRDRGDVLSRGRGRLVRLADVGMGRRDAREGRPGAVLVLSGLTAAAMAVQLGASRSAAVIAASWFCLCTPLVLFSFEGNVDTIFVCGYLLSIYFLIEWSKPTADRALLVTAMLGLGLALGTKPTAVLFVPFAALLAAVVAWRKRESLSDFVRSLAIIVLVPLTPSGYWFARNLLVTGNPLYPLHLAVGDLVILRGWYDRSAMRFSPYFIPLERWTALADTLMALMDSRLAPFWLLAVAGCWRIGRGRSKDHAWVWALSGLAVVNVLVYWLLIPYRTQQRFMLQAFGLAAVPLSLLFDRGRVVRWVAAGLLLVRAITPQGWPMVGDPRAQAPWDLDPLIPNRLPALVPIVSRAGIVPHACELGAVALVAAAAWALLRSRLCAVAFAAFAACLMAGSALASRGEFQARDSRVRFYPDTFRDYYRGWMALDKLAGTNGSTLAYAGTDLPYYLLGVGLRNNVRYININKHRDWLMHDYARVSPRRLWPDTRPGWDRDPAEASYEAWLENLEAAGVDLLVVTKANPAEGRFNPTRPDDFPVERRWADAHPESFTLEYPRDFPDPLFRVYRFKSRGG